MLLRSGFFHPLFQQIGNGVAASRCGFFYFVRVDAERDVGIGMSHNTGNRRNVGSRSDNSSESIFVRLYKCRLAEIFWAC